MHLVWEEWCAVLYSLGKNCNAQEQVEVEGQVGMSTEIGVQI
jgi:hypothetical protein